MNDESDAEMDLYSQSLRSIDGSQNVPIRVMRNKAKKKLTLAHKCTSQWEMPKNRYVFRTMGWNVINLMDWEKRLSRLISLTRLNERTSASAQMKQWWTVNEFEMKGKDANRRANTVYAVSVFRFFCVCVYWVDIMNLDGYRLEREREKRGMRIVAWLCTLYAQSVVHHFDILFEWASLNAV